MRKPRAILRPAAFLIREPGFPQTSRRHHGLVLNRSRPTRSGACRIFSGFFNIIVSRRFYRAVVSYTDTVVLYHRPLPGSVN